MQTKRGILISAMILIFLIGGMYIFTDWFSKVTGYLVGEDENTKLAQCLDGQGAEFYCSLSLAVCEKQKEELGKAFKYIEEYDCGEDMEYCINIKEIPAWYINKTIVYGFQNRSDLRILSGCVDE